MTTDERNALVMANRGWASDIAWRFWRTYGLACRFGSLEDVQQEALSLLITAADKWEPERAKFTTFAHCLLWGELMNRAKTVGLIHVPAHAILKSKPAHIREAANKAMFHVRGGQRTAHTLSFQSDLVGAVAQKETVAAVRKAIALLPKEKWRDLIRMRFGITPCREPMTLQAIADAWGTSRQNMEQTEDRALKYLHRHFKHLKTLVA